MNPITYGARTHGPLRSGVCIPGADYPAAQEIPGTCGIGKYDVSSPPPSPPPEIHPGSNGFREIEFFARYTSGLEFLFDYGAFIWGVFRDKRWVWWVGF